MLLASRAGLKLGKLLVEVSFTVYSKASNTDNSTCSLLTVLN